MDIDRTVKVEQDKAQEAKRIIAEAMLKAKMRGPKPIPPYTPPDSAMTVRG